jgi:hypothetical protein
MERREAPRITPEGIIPVRLLVPGRLETGTVFDLNNGGAFIATELVLEKGEELNIEFDVPGTDSMPLQAVVARQSEEIKGKNKTVPAGLGIVFMSDTPEEREHIQKVVMSALTLDLLNFSYDQQQMGKLDANETKPM